MSSGTPSSIRAASGTLVQESCATVHPMGFVPTGGVEGGECMLIDSMLIAC